MFSSVTIEISGNTDNYCSCEIRDPVIEDLVVKASLYQNLWVVEPILGLTLVRYIFGNWRVVGKFVTYNYSRKKISNVNSKSFLYFIHPFSNQGSEN